MMQGVFCAIAPRADTARAVDDAIKAAKQTERE